MVYKKNERYRRYKREYYRVYRKAKRGKVRAIAKKSRLKHLERTKRQRREYGKRNREKLNDSQKQSREKYPEKWMVYREKGRERKIMAWNKLHICRKVMKRLDELLGDMESVNLTGATDLKYWGQIKPRLDACMAFSERWRQELNLLEGKILQNQVQH